MLRTEEKLQLHIKVMPDGRIESEMEPPHAYPAAHLNPEHSYPAHEETRQILALSGARYMTPYPIPSTCRNPKIKKPDNPTHAADFLAAGIIGVFAAAIIREWLKDDEEEDR